MNSQDIKQQTIEAIERAGNLDRREKRRLLRIMHSPFRVRAQQTIVDSVTSHLVETGELEVTPAGVEPAVDWDSIISAIEKLLPLILQLVKLFG